MIVHKRTGKSRGTPKVEEGRVLRISSTYESKLEIRKLRKEVVMKVDKVEKLHNRRRLKE